MTFEPERDQYYQYATFIVIGVIVVTCLCYALLFFRPDLNVIVAMRPATPAFPTAVPFPPTFTPISTKTPTLTTTAEPTEIPPDTETPGPVIVDTALPTITLTPRPSATNRPPAPTARPPAPTARPPAPTATRVPFRTATPRPPGATSTPSPSFVRIKIEPSPNCGTWYIQGTIWSNGYGSGFVPGTLVRAWVNGQVYATDTAGSHNKNNPAYWEILFPKNQAENGSVAIVDANGHLLSPQYSFQLTADCHGSSAVNEIIMDFTRQ